MLYDIARKTLETYLREKRVITLSEIPADSNSYLSTKESVFVTLYFQGKVIASSGRIQCKKENTLYECIDNTLMCLKDARFSDSMQTVENLSQISIRIDKFSLQSRRVLKDISELDISKEGLIYLSIPRGLMSVVLPHMPTVASTPSEYLTLALSKVQLQISDVTPEDSILYAITTIQETDF